ncbi:Shedu immune nuclease family protein [Methanoculleus sp.]|uniref:Shedu immune nuclease family protein n=1 Tax=Methanoculleus sp. TaxID=90427 RepID=UPI0025ED8452|nr:Shedu immune nuclease family protein [Methanoculleus sp.]MCK9319213.1 DUF4263 domain-containing protein [Methanoculleus sp.]
MSQWKILDTNSFDLEKDSFDDISIVKSQDKEFYYFTKNKAPIKEFILKNLEKGERKICSVVLIKKNEKYEPRISFKKINAGKKIINKLGKTKIEDEKIKASIDLSDCFKNFKKLINFFIDSESIDFKPSDYAIMQNIIKEGSVRDLLIEKIIKEGVGEDFCKKIIDENISVSSAILNYIEVKNKKNVLEEFKKRLKDKKIKEVAGDDSWQKWFNVNYWFFGANYIKVIDRQKISISGLMPDFLYLSLDNFIDILEIKLPKHKVIKKGKHSGSWVWTPETNEAIGQVVNYLSEIDRLKLEIEAAVEKTFNVKINLLKPRAYILIGNSEDWENDKKAGLKKLNYALHEIEVLTYNDLLKRVENNINLYKSE